MADSIDHTTQSDDDLLKFEESKGLLRYPITHQTEIPNWVVFTRKEYSKDSMLADSKLKTVEDSNSVALPLPAALDKGYMADWDMDNLGAWGNQLRNGVVGAEKMLENVMNGSSISDEVKSIGAAGFSDIAKNIVTAFAADASMNNDVVKRAGVATGLARNPFKAQLFNTVGFRSFNFNYKLMAKNLDEATAIREIIREFQIGMSPDFSEAFENNIFKYPDVYHIRFTDDKYLFKMTPCVLTQFNVNYHAEGTPIYFKSTDGTRVPASVQLEMQFRETAILSREDFKNGGY